MLEGKRSGDGPTGHRRCAGLRLRGTLLALAAAVSMLVGLASASAAAARAVNNLPPEVVGNPVVGERLVCASGSWSGLVKEFTYEWIRNGIDVSTNVAYTVQVADKGATLWCLVTAVGGEPPYPVATSKNSVKIPGGEQPTPPRDESPPQVSVSGQPVVGSKLTCLTGTWRGNPAPSFSYQWLREEAVIKGATSSTYTAGPEDAGRSLSCEVTATNQAGSQTVPSSNSVTIAAVKPVNERRPQVLGAEEPIVGESLTCSPGKWSETPPPTYSYRWVRDKGLPEEAVIAGATGSGYTVGFEDELQTLSCIVTATNGAGSTEATSSNSLRVKGSAPKNTAPPLIGGTPEVGQTLTCSTGTWTGKPAPESYKFVWIRNDGRTGEEVITSATSDEYSATSNDSGKTLSCEVTAKNTEGKGSSLSAPVVVPANNLGDEPPVRTEEPTIFPSANVALGTTLTCGGSKWTGNPEPTLSYEWLRDGAAISSATEEKYVVAETDEGHLLSCRVTAINEQGIAFGESGSVEVAGTIPQDVTSPTASVVGGGTPVVGSQLKCVPGKWSGAPAPAFTYQWLRNGAEIPSEISQNYTVASEDGATSISCRVTAKNSAGTASAISNSIEVPGRRPRNTAAPSISGAAAVGATLTCSPGTWSGQPTPSYSYQWLLNGTAIPGEAGSTYVVGAADPGLSVSCEVTANNGEGKASAVSGPLHIPGAAPHELEAPHVSGTANVGQALACEAGLWSGEPPPAFAYQWLRDGSAIAGATSLTYTVEFADQGHTLSCEVTATNSEGTAEATSGGVTVAGPTATKSESKLPEPTFPPPPDPPAPATTAQILTSLGAQLAHAQRRARVSLVRKTGQYSFSFTALAAGRLELAWYARVKDPLHPSAPAKTVLLGHGATSFAGAGTKTVKLIVNSAGRRVFRENKFVKLSVKGVFVIPHTHTLSWLETVVLSH
jgi:hypothetical protein